MPLPHLRIDTTNSYVNLSKMVSFSLILCALLSVVLSASLASANTGPLPVEVDDLMATDPNSMYVFSVSYSAEGCSESSSAVMFRSFLADTASPDVMASTQMGFCAQNLMCMVDPEGNPNMCPTPTGDEDSTTAMYTIDLSIGDDGMISNTRNQTRGPDVCLFGSWYSGEGQDCYYNVKLLENFKQTPELMANDNPQDLEMMKEYIYLAYYEDDACTDLSAIVTTASGKQIDLPQVSNPDLSCNIQAICGIDPASHQCKAIQDEAVAVAERFAETRVDPETNELDVYECDSSNEAVGQEECALFRPQDCGESSIFTNCYFRYVSGPEFATHPRVIVGEVLADKPDPEIETPSNSTGTDMEGDMDGDIDGMAPDGIIEQLGTCIVPSDLGKDVIDTECVQNVLSSLNPTIIEHLAQCAGLGSFTEMQACVEEQLSGVTSPPVADPTDPPTSSANGYNGSSAIVGFTIAAVFGAASFFFNWSIYE